MSYIISYQYPNNDSGQSKSQASCEHQSISNRNHYSKGEDTARYTPCQEMLDLKVALPRLRNLHHDGSYFNLTSATAIRSYARVKVDSLIFGNPEVGRPIAAEHIRALPMTSKFGCGCFIPAPTCCTRGRMIKAATV